MTPEEQKAHDMSMQLEGARKERGAWMKYFKRRKNMYGSDYIPLEVTRAITFGAHRHDRYLKAKGGLQPRS